MEIAVVILNWNTREYLERFLPRLIESCDGLEAGVVVADNASDDGSVQMLQEKFPQVEIIRLDRNYGFTGGYNRALEQIEAEYFVLINSDVEVAPGWLKALKNWMDSHSECGVCGPKLLSYSDRTKFEYAGAAGGYLDIFGYPYCRGRVLHRTEKDEGQYDFPESLLWVSGACMMVRSSLWKHLRGFDDRFFAHMEEIDFCWRAQLEGYKVTNVPQSKVFHIGGGTLANDSPFKLKLNFRNNLLMLENNLPASIGKIGAGIVFAFRWMLDDAVWLGYMLKGRKDYARSVCDAHKEFKKLHKKFTVPGRRHKTVDGINKGFIFVKSITSRFI